MYASAGLSTRWARRTSVPMAMVQLILGKIGLRGGGVNALRGHSNIQGLTDLGLMSDMLPGYLTLPTRRRPITQGYMKSSAYKPLRPGQTTYWQNNDKFHNQLPKIQVLVRRAPPENNLL